MTVFRPAPDVVWIDASSMPGISTTEAIWASRASDARPIELSGWAWLIWRQVIQGGTADEISAAVSATRALPVDGSVDVPGFLAQLEKQGFLIASNDSSGEAEHPTEGPRDVPGPPERTTRAR